MIRYFGRLVVDGGDFWLIQLYDPNDESYKESASLWEAACIPSFYIILDKTWKYTIRIGRINAVEEPGLISRIPFNIQSYPSIVAISAKGECDLLPFSSSYNPTEMEETLLELLNKPVKIIPFGNARSFLQLDSTLSSSSLFSSYNVLLLRRKTEIPKQFLKYVVGDQKIMSIGVSEPGERHEYEGFLDVHPEENLLITYPKYNIKEDKILAVKKHIVSATEFNPVFRTLVRHTIVGMTQILISSIDIYKNNYMKYCSRYVKPQAKKEETDEKTIRRLICVVALVDDSSDNEGKFIRYQQHVHSLFSSALKEQKQKYSRRKAYDVQYAAVNLNWHPELQQFLYKTQNSTKINPKKMNFMIITSDNEAFSIVNASSSMKRNKR